MRSAFLRHTTSTACLSGRAKLRLITPESDLYHGGMNELPAEFGGLPWWSILWPGGNAMYNFIRDSYSKGAWPAGRRFIDFGCGCGIAAIAALQAGAEEVVAIDIDPLSEIATLHNVELNGFDASKVHFICDDVVGDTTIFRENDMVGLGDMLYCDELCRKMLPWLQGAISRHDNLDVFIGDPFRYILVDYKKSGEFDKYFEEHCVITLDDDVLKEHGKQMTGHMLKMKGYI